MNTKASKNTFTVVKILHSAISNIESKRTVGLWELHKIKIFRELKSIINTSAGINCSGEIMERCYRNKRKEVKARGTE